MIRLDQLISFCIPNQQIVSPDIGVNYPYKAMIDQLLNSTNDMTESQPCYFYKDSVGAMGLHRYVGSNTTFFKRAEHTKDGQVGSVKGCLYLDFALEQNRAVLNGLPINLILFQ